MTSATITRLTQAVPDRYAIDREIGAGGMAARIEIAARLSHPHILPLFDSGAAGELLYYVMPYVPGESLRSKLVRDRHLPIDGALRLTREIASALGSAHSQGIVHRDIKPENILLADGSALVADFGIARALRSSRAQGDTASPLTMAGLALGTPAYMSPEQVTADEVDGRTDLYAFGCVLFEMLAGHHGAMRIVAFITQASVIDVILTHLRTRASREAHAGPRSPPSTRGPAGPSAPPGCPTTPRGGTPGPLSHTPTPRPRAGTSVWAAVPPARQPARPIASDRSPPASPPLR